MKNLLAVILLALCALVVTSNTSKAQDDDVNLPSWTVTIHGELGVGLITGATVKVFNSSNTQIYSGTTLSDGTVGWSIPTGFPSGYYRIHLDDWNTHVGGDKTIYYTNGPVVENMNIGPAY